jgi:hypothetical protein
VSYLKALPKHSDEVTEKKYEDFQPAKYMSERHSNETQSYRSSHLFSTTPYCTICRNLLVAPEGA